jgi:hypothetical protein
MITRAPLNVLMFCLSHLKNIAIAYYEALVGRKTSTLPTCTHMLKRWLFVSPGGGEVLEHMHKFSALTVCGLCVYIIFGQYFEHFEKRRIQKVQGSHALHMRVVNWSIFL